MKRTIHYSRTVGSNEGMPDYSNKIMSAEKEIDEGDSFEESLKALQNQVDRALGLIKEEAPKPTAKKKSKKKATKKKEATKKPVEVDENGEEWYDDSEPVTPESPVQEEKVVEEKKPTTKKKTSKKKAIPYDNTVDKHKKIIGDLTAEILGKDWVKDSDMKEKVRAAARGMIGKDFLNKDGEVTEKFRETYSKLLNS